ncbi:MAG: hypothetical protein KC766_30300 [Myxococcales bacterium]|nr:hypothetical protein [Myxococcales bacterium]
MLSRFIAPDVRRDVLITSVAKIDAGIITGRVRTVNVLYVSKGLTGEPELEPPKELRIDQMWDWSGQPWGGLPDGTSIADREVARAHWLDDGFLHPPSQRDTEFVDVDGFVRVPVEGLGEMVHFARVRVVVGDRARDCVVVDGAPPSKELLSREIGRRYDGVVPVFVESSAPGQVLIDARDEDEHSDIAAAITACRSGWDESVEVRVVAGSSTMAVRVTFDGASETYEVHTRLA